MQKTVLILGASGKIGHHCAIAFRAAGWHVRVYDRKAGDMVQAAKGCDVIVNGLNPPAYRNWATEIPRITRDVIAAASSSGATVIMPANVYVFSPRPGIWGENTPHHPETRKGRIRAEMEAAYRASGVRVILLRAGDFIDPERNGTLMGLVMLKDIAKGRVTRLGAPEVKRQYCYLPDFARAAVALAGHDGLERFEDIPFPGPVFSAEALCAELQVATGRKLRLAAFPWWALRLASPVWTLGREMLEMRYLFEIDHALDHGKFDRLLPEFRFSADHVAMRAELPEGMANPTVATVSLIH